MKSDLLRNSELFIFLALIFSVFTAVLLANLENLEERGEEFRKEKNRINGQYEKCDSLSDLLREENRGLVEERDGLNIKIEEVKGYREELIDSLISRNPPHILIDGANRFFFETGEYNLSVEFKRYLDTIIVKELLTNLELYPACNSLYIVGHTDAMGMRSGRVINRNIDKDIVDEITKESGKAVINFNSNGDLGLLRAISIYKYLKTKDEFKEIEYWFPYSAGALIDNETKKIITDLDQSEDVEKKRRIELWLYEFN